MLPLSKPRRTATSVMAGAFDTRPPRDVLTSLLNGVPPYPPAGAETEEKKARRKEKRRRDKGKGKEKATTEVMNTAPTHEVNATPDINGLPVATPTQSVRGTSSFWRAKPHPHPRPQIHIATMQRSVSVTPPPVTSPLFTPGSTPGPSSSSSTSRTSSKRPRTPDDDEDVPDLADDPPARPPRKRRPAARKGWKGWVEGSPPPSDKLINLDGIPVLHERRTRSGKNFDAISVGGHGWV